jgi:outer membrane protein TolC
MSIHVLLPLAVTFAAIAIPAAAEPLTLVEAERLALTHAPSYAQAQANLSAAAERVVHEGRLPDPQLYIGVVNVPSDSFKLDEEDMTMTMIGVRQAFPPGATRSLRTRRAEHEQVHEQSRLEGVRRALLRDVRQTWLQLYYLDSALKVLRENQTLQRAQLRSIEARYRAGVEPPQAVLKTRQVLARLEQREPMLQAEIAKTQARLARWIGPRAWAPLPDTLPTLATAIDSIEVKRHPEVQAAYAMRDAAQAEADIARQDYKPGLMLDLSYGIRRSSPTGVDRSDMVSAMVTFDLPIFRAKRQDRRLAERQALELAARHEAEDRAREFEAMFQAVRAEIQALEASERIFATRIVPDAQREADVTVSGFAREQTELREARMKALEAELELTRLRVDLTKARAELLYLSGETTP